MAKQPCELFETLISKRLEAAMIQGVIQGLNITKATCDAALAANKDKLFKLTTEISKLDTAYQNAMIDLRYGDVE